MSRHTRLLGLIAAMALLASPAVADTWVSSATGGFGNVSNIGIRALRFGPFGFLAGTERAATAAQILRSPTGAPGSWTPIATLNPGLTNVNMVVGAMTDTTGAAFVGIDSGLGGALVYRATDGSNFYALNGPGTPFLGAGNGAVSLLDIQGDSLYAGFSNPAGAQLWRMRLNDTFSWERPLDFAQLNNRVRRIHDAVRFLDTYVIATDDTQAGSSMGGRLFASRTGDSNSWQQVSIAGFGSSNNVAITALAVFQNELYAGTENPANGAEIWKSLDGVNWQPVMQGGFGQLQNQAITDLGVFRGALWAAVRAMNPASAQIYRSWDGKTFVYSVAQSGFGVPNNREGHPVLAHSGDTLLWGGENVANGAEVWQLGLPIAQASAAPGAAFENRSFRPLANQTLGALTVRGDTSVPADTLLVFRVENMSVASPTSWSAIRLAIDADGDSTFTPGDTVLTDLSLVGGGAYETKGLSIRVPAGGLRLVVVADVSNSATPGDSFAPRIAARTLGFAWAESGPVNTLALPSSLTIVDSAGPNTWYVNDASLIADSFTTARGSDYYSGLVPRFPLRRIRAAAERTSVGDTITIDAGTYTESVAILADSVVIHGRDSISTIIDVGDTSAGMSWNGILVSGQTGVRIGKLAIRRAYTGLNLNPAYGTFVSSVSVESCFQGVHVQNSSNGNTFTDLRVRASSQYGLWFATSSAQNTLASSLFTQNTLGGVVSTANNNLVENNLITGNGDFGVHLSLSATSNTFRGNTISGNTGHGLHIISGSSSNVFHGNLIESNTYHGVNFASAGGGNRFFRNRIRFNTVDGMAIGGTTNVEAVMNEFDSNGFYAVRVDSSSTNPFLVKNNVLSGPANPDSRVLMNAATAADMTRNWWGTTDSAALDRGISGPFRTGVTLVPYRLGPVATTTDTADTIAPRAPDTVAGIVLNPTTVRLAWARVTLSEEPSADSLGLAGYRVWRSRAPDSPTWQQIAQLASTVDTFVDGGLQSDTNYYYRITAFDSASPENQSFYSDSVAGLTPSLDTSGPNAWYVNDTAAANDSFTFAPGNDAQSGLTRLAPKRTLAAVLPLLTPGDSVYIDAGLYADAPTINTDSVVFTGRDSTAAGTVFEGGWIITGRSGVILENLRAQNVSTGFDLNNSNNCVLRNLAACTTSSRGFFVQGTSSSNLVEGCVSDNAVSSGFYLLNSGSGNALRRNLSRRSNYGFDLGMSQTLVEENVAEDNTMGGFYLTASNQYFRGNVARNNGQYGFHLVAVSNCVFIQNSVESNGVAGFLVAAGSFADTFYKNNYAPAPGGTDVFLQNDASATTFEARRNWFGTIDSAAVRARISGTGAGDVLTTPYRLGSVALAPNADTVAPRAPDTVAVVDLLAGQARVSWAASTVDEESTPAAFAVAAYRVYRAGGIDSASWILRGEVPAGTTTFVDSGLPSAETRVYRVTARDSAMPTWNESFFSETFAVFFSYAVPADTTIPPTITGSYDTVVTGASTETGVTIGQANVDTLALTVPSATGQETWVVRMPFSDTGNTVRVRRVPDPVMQASDTALIRGFARGYPHRFEVDVFDSAGQQRTDSYWSQVGESIVLTFSFGQSGIETHRAVLYWLNTRDSRWYDVTHPESGMTRAGYVRGADSFSVPVDHFTHFFPGEGIVDTVTVVPGPAVKPGAMYRNETVVVGSVFVMGDTGANGDTLLSFAVRNQGNLGPAQVNSVRLFEDSGARGVYEPNVDSPVGELFWSIDRWVNNALSHPFSQNDTGTWFLVTVEAGPSAIHGDTFRLFIPSGSVGSADEETGPALNQFAFPIKMVVDTPGPRTWYVNDTAQVNDTYTHSIGQDVYDGLTPWSPKRTFHALEALLAPGDTVLFDVGDYFEPDTALVETGPIRIRGVDSTLTRIHFLNNTQPAFHGLWFRNSFGHVVSDLRIRGGYHGLGLDNADSVTALRVWIDSATQYGVFAGNGSDSLHLAASLIERSGGSGFYSSGAFGLRLAGNRARLNGNAGFNPDGGSLGAYLSGNVAESNVYGVVLGTGSHYAVLESNSLLANSQNGLYVNTHSDSFVGNLIAGNGAAGAYFAGTGDSVTFESNIVTGNAAIGVHLSGSTWGLFQGNRVFGNSGEGFYVVSSGPNIFRQNHVESNASSNAGGFSLSSSFGCLLDRNVVRDNAHGVILANSGGCTLVGNTFDSNAQYAVWIDGVNPGVVLEKNNVQTSPTRPDSFVRMTALDTVIAVRNWWFTRDSAAIRRGIQGPGGDSFLFHPFRLGAVDTAPGADTVAPAAPDSVTANAVNESMVLVSWTPSGLSEEPEVAAGAIAYRVWRSPVAETSIWAFLDTVSFGVNQYLDSGLAVYTPYHYKVTVMDAATPWPNESYYSDSTASVTLLPDASGPNVWYVNDTSTVGDSYSSAPGSPLNHGRLPSSPLPGIGWLNGLLTAGDTIFIDAGTYFGDSLSITVSSVTLLGVDSTLTVLQGFDSSITGPTAFSINTCTAVGISGLAMRDYYRGVFGSNADTSVFSNLRVERMGGHGFEIMTGADSVTFRNNEVVGANGAGIYVDNSQLATVAFNRFDSVAYGVRLTAMSHNATVIDNTIDSAATGIEVGGSSLATRIAGNILSATGSGGAIKLDFASDIIVESNVIQAARGVGIFANGADRSFLLYNRVSAGLETGITVVGTVDSFVIVGNTVTGNDSFALGVGGSFVHAERNSFRDNRAGGIAILGSANRCTFVLNEIDSNGVAVMISSGSWDINFFKNILLGSPSAPESVVLSEGAGTFNFARNWWGVTDSAAVRRRIGGINPSAIQYLPFRLGIPDTRAGADTIAPRAPDTVAAYTLSETAIRVEWNPYVNFNEDGNAVPSDLAGYRVYAAPTVDSTSWALMAQLPAPVGSFVDSNLVPGTTRHYRVTSFDTGTPENQSFYSDSYGFAVAAPDTNGPNVWYVNDTSLTGDSFTSAVGHDSNHGRTPNYPALSLQSIIPFLTPGDTVLIDAGIYADTLGVLPGVYGVTFTGVDSALTVLAYGDSGPGPMISGLSLVGCSQIVVRNLTIQDVYRGIDLSNTDSCVFEDVAVRHVGFNGIRVQPLSDGNAFTRIEVRGTGGDAVVVDGGFANVFTGMVVSQSQMKGAVFQNAAMRNLLAGSRIESTFQAGVSVTNAADNIISENTIVGTGSDGIYVFSANGTRVESNILAPGSAANSGILLDGSDYCTVSWNRVQGWTSGLKTQNNADFGLFEGNTARGNFQYGFYADGSGHLARRNLYADNSFAGVLLAAAASNQSHLSNRFDSNAVSVEVMAGATSCTFAKNNFLGTPTAESHVYTMGGTLLFQRNWWGTTDSFALSARIAGASALSVYYLPYRLGPVDTEAGADSVAPKAPDTVAATALNANSIRVSWSGSLDEEDYPGVPAPDISGYRVWTSPTAETSQWTLLDTLAAGARAYDHTGLALGVTRYYRVTAFDSATVENQSFWSDSIAGAQTVLDTSGANAWYVNDEYTAGDSFTSAPGSDTALGVVPYAPFRTISRALFFATPGDIIYVDSGIYVETVVIETDAVTILGLDSSAAIIDPPGASGTVGLHGIYADTQVGLVINGIRVVDAYDGIRLVNVDSARISASQFQGLGGAGITLKNGSESILVEGNFILNSSIYGLSIEDSSNFVRVEGNRFVNTGTAVSLYLSDYVSLTSNAMLSNGSGGVSVNGSRQVAIDANEISGNGFAGVHLYSGTAQTRIAHNRIAAHSGRGILLDNAESNLVVMNLVTANDTGIAVHGTSQNNIVRANNIYGNTLRAWDRVGVAVVNDALRNWWGSKDSLAVIAGISDANLAYTPYRLGIVDTTVGADTVAPAAPDTVAILATTETTAVVAWSTVTLDEDGSALGGLSGYRVYRDTQIQPTTRTLVATIPAGTTTFLDSALSGFTTYHYAVTSFDSNGTYGNEAYYAATIASATTFPDTSGPNTWYVNDTALAGDSYTSAVGSSANHGLLPSSPKRTLNDIESLLTPGDTVLVDAGLYYEPDTVRIAASNVRILGVDSTLSQVLFGDTSSAADRSLYLGNVTGVLVRDLAIAGGRYGIVATNADTGTYQRLHLTGAGLYGFWLSTGSEANTVTDVRATGNANSGFVIQSSNLNTLSGVTASGHSIYGIYFTAAHGCTVADAVTCTNATAGVHVNSSSGIRIESTLSYGNGTGFAIDGTSSGNVLVGDTASNNSTGFSLASVAVTNTRLSRNLAHFNTMGFSMSGSSATVIGNLARANSLYGFSLSGDSGSVYAQNTLDSNGYGVRILLTCTDVVFHRNNLLGGPSNPDSLVLAQATGVTMTRNWWGVVDSTAVRARISGLYAPAVTYAPYRLSDVDTALGADTIAPRAPDTVAVGNQTETAVTVAWATVTANEDGYGGAPVVAGYSLYHAPTPDTANWTLTGTVGPAVTTYVDSGRSLFETRYYRVVAFDAASRVNKSYYSDSIVLGLTADSTVPSAPALQAPAAGTDTNITTILFTWTASTDTGGGIAGYRLQLDTSVGFASPLVDSATGNITAAIRTVTANETWYWRIVAVDAAGNTAASAARLLRVDTLPPSAPGYLAPTANLETNVVTQTFSWTASSDSLTGVAAYRFQLDTAGTFAVPVVDTTMVMTSITLTMAANETYYWRVSANDSATNTTVGATRMLLVDTAGPNGIITLLSPAAGLETNTTVVAFSWTASSDALSGVAGYRLQVDTAGTFAAVGVETFTAGTGATLLLAGTETYYWRVVAVDDAGNTAASSSRVLRIDTTGPTAPTLLSPANVDTNAVALTFSWTASLDSSGPVTQYRLQIDTAGVFSALVYDTTVAGTSLAVPLAPNDTYWWRVLAYDSASNATASASARVRIDTIPPIPPGYSAVPNNYDTNVTTLTFAWAIGQDTGTGIAYYRFQVDTFSPSFTAPYIDTILFTTSVTLDNLNTRETQAWRVLVYDSAGNSATVGHFVLRIDTEAPTAPALLAPADSIETSAGTVVFTWTASQDSMAGVSRYRFQLANTLSFTTLLKDSFTTALSDSFTFTTSDSYYWRVAAIDSATNTGTSAIRVLRWDNGSPTPAGLVQPPDGHDTFVTTVLFQWTASTDSNGIAGYRLQIDTTPSFALPLVDSQTGNVTSASRTLAANDTYWWRLIAIDNSNNTSTSTSHVLRIDTTPPSAPSLLSPEAFHDTSNGAVTFTWTASSDALSGLARYRFQLDTAGTFLSPFADTPVTGTSLAVLMYTEGTRWWRVIAVDSAGNTAASDTRRIRLDLSTPSQPTQLAPANPTDTTQTTLTFAWTAATDSVTGIAVYRLQFDTSSGFTTVSIDSTVSGSVTSAVRTLPANETWYWRVTAVDSGGSVTPSAGALLRIDTAPPSKPITMFPIEQDTSATTHIFTWTASSDSITGFLKYRFQIDTSGFFVSPFRDTEIFGRVQDTVTLPANDTYFWRVWAYDTLLNYAISSSFRLRIDTAPPSAPSLTAPAVNTDTSATTLTVAWTASFDTFVGVASYRLQIDTSGLFSLPILDTTTTGTSLTLSNVQANAAYYLRVLAVDAAGNVSASSETRQVRVDTSPPTTPALTSPAADVDTSASTLTVSWTASTDALLGLVSYRLQIDTTGVFSALVLDTTTGATTLTLAAVPANETYFLRILASDSVGNTAVSATRRVRVDTASPSAPSFTSPAVDVDTNATTLTVSWTASADALSGVARYRLQADTSGLFALPALDTTTTATSLTLVGIAANETYFLRAFAVDSAGNSSVSSALRRVRIDTAPPSRPTLLAPAEGLDTSVTTLTFSWTASIDSIVGVAGYRFEIDTATGFAAPFVQTFTSATSTVQALPANDTYRWRVVAFDSVGNVAASDSRLLVVDTGTAAFLQLTVNATLPSGANLVAYGADQTAVLAFSVQSATGDTLTAAGVGFVGPAGTSNRFSLVRLFRDLDRNAAFDSNVDVLVSTMTSVAASEWRATGFSQGFGTGDSFLVVVTLHDTTPLDDTFRAYVPAISVKTSLTETGPIAALFAPGIFTIKGPATTLVVDPIRPISATVNPDGADLSSVLAFTVGGAPSDTLTVLNVSLLGSASTFSKIDTLALYRDGDRDGNVGSADTLVSLLTLQGSVYALATPVLLPVSGLDSFVVAVSFSSAAVSGDTLRASLPAFSVRTASRDTQPATPITSPAVLYLDTGSSLVNIAVNASTLSETIAPLALDVTRLMSLTITGNAGDTIRSFSVQLTGSAGQVNRLDYVILYKDVNRNGAYDSGTDIAQSLLGLIGNQTYAMSGLSIPLGATGSESFLVAVSVRDTAPSGETMLAVIPAQGVKTTLRDTGPAITMPAPAVFYVYDLIPPAAFTLASPASGAVTGNPGVTLGWNATTDAGSGLAWYRLQVARSLAFTPLAVDTNVGLLTSYAPGLPGDTVYYWRVIAYDANGNARASSDTRSIVVDLTPPSRPSPVTPVADLETSAATQVFSWTSATDTLAGLSGYRLQASYEPGLSSLALDTPVGTALSVTRTLSSGAVHYWRIAAVDSAGNTSYSDTRKLTLVGGGPLPATLVAPVSGLETSSTTLLFSWTASPETLSTVAGYTLQVDTAGTFTAPIVSAAVGLSTQATAALPANQTYSWRVVVSNTLGLQTASATRTVIVDTAVAVALFSPADSVSTTDTRPTFIWTSDGETWTWEVSRDTTGGPAAESHVVVAKNTQSAGLAGGTWFWRVTALDRAGNTAVTGWFRLWIDTGLDPVIDTTPPATFTLLAPLDGAWLSTPAAALDWAATTDTGIGMDSYRVQVAADSLFAASLFDSALGVAASALTTTPLPVETRLYWRVIAYDRNGNARTSFDTRSFRIDTAAPAAPPALLSPMPGSDTAVATIAFRWSAGADSQSGVAGYRIQVDSGGTFAAPFRDGTSVGAETVLSGFGQATWSWRVQTLDAAGNASAWTSTETFRIQTIPPSAPTPLSPASGATISETRPRLDWSDVAGAVAPLAHYRIELASDSAFTAIVLSDATADTTSETTAPALAARTWWWRVAARDQLGNLSAWASDSFTIDTTVPAAPVINTPATDTVLRTRSFTFQWSVSGLSSSLLAGYQAVVRTAHGDTFTDTFLSTSQITLYTRAISGFSETIYTLSVRAQTKAGAWGPWSTSRTFGVDSTPPVPAMGAESTAPRGGAETTATSIGFVLGSYTDTGVGGSTVSYLVQIARDSAFGTILHQERTTTTRFTPTYLFGESNTVYWWRYAAVDTVGNQSPFATPDSFRRPSADAGRPFPVAFLRAAPTDAGDIVLSWYGSPSSDVARYNIFWNTGTTNAAADTLLGTVSHDGQESYSWSVSSRAALTAGVFYLFRVHAQDTGGNQDTFGAIAGAAPRSAAPTHPYASIIEPQSGRRVLLTGGVQVVARVEGTRPSAETVVFEFRRSGGGSWTTMTSSDATNFPNPRRIGAETRTVYGIRWNALAQGVGHDSTIEIRAVAQLSNRDSRPAFSEVVVMGATTSETDANVSSDSERSVQRGVNGHPMRILMNLYSLDLPSRAFSSLLEELIRAQLRLDTYTPPASSSGLGARGAAASAATLAALVGRDTVAGSVLNIDFTDSVGGALTRLAAGKTARITAALPSGYRPESLVMRSAHSGGDTQEWRYDSVANQPSLSAFSWDSANNTATFLTERFSSFVFVVPAASSGGPGNQTGLDRFMVYPNPWRPNDGNPATGLPYDPANPRTTGIVFDYLPARVKVEVFTLRGERVFEQTTAINDGYATWNGRNQGHQEVASGYYLYVVTDLATGRRVTGKLAVIR